MMMMYSQEPTTTDQKPDHETPCPSCFSSPSSSSHHHRNPKRDRPFTPPLSPSSSLLGRFTNLPLPLTPSSSPPMTTFPPLRRCTSDPVPLMLPENVQVGGFSSDVATPSKRLCRSVSAPEKDLIADSPNSKRLKRMKEQMREISKWCDQVIAEGDEEGEDEREDHLVDAEVVNNEAPKDDETEVKESEEEALSVEKNGDCLIIHMRCPCSKAYQFLLSGDNCYYKIM